MNVQAALDGGRYLSRFGGFWTDRSNAHEIAAAMLQSGEINEQEQETLDRFIDDGYAILKNAVSDDRIEAFLSDLEKVWSGETPRTMSYWDADGHHVAPAARELMMHGEAKLLDFHWPSLAAQDLIFAPDVLRFLKLVFRDDALAFQGLYFQRGSEQGIHQDTAFVFVDESPLEFVASWIALEDVKPGTGELLYVPGSHRLPDLTFSSGTKKCLPDDPLLPKYVERVRENYESHGLEKQAFLPKKGDVLFWAADLAHGGAPITSPGTTRRSMVTHYCPLNRRPDYIHRNEASEVRETRSGGYVISKDKAYDL